MIPTVIAGMNVPPDDVENIRYNEAVKQYRSGRYIDPNNTRIMYERNVVYKVEDDAWPDRGLQRIGIGRFEL